MFTLLKAFAHFLPFLTRSMDGDEGGNKSNGMAKMVILLLGSVAVNGFLIFELEKVNTEKTTLREANQKIEVEKIQLQGKYESAAGYRTVAEQLQRDTRSRSEQMARIMGTNSRLETEVGILKDDLGEITLEYDALLLTSGKMTNRIEILTAELAACKAKDAL